jgi:SAM-dependent methyltransferase
VNRYQSHSFVWKYGSSLLELIDFDALSNLAGASTIRAFDVGCGSGQLTKLLHDELAQRLEATNGAPDANASLQVFGMDLDPDMIAVAQDQFPEVRFFVGDARNFQLPHFNNAAPEDGVDEPSVHLILSNAALHWIPPLDVDRAVKSISRVLVPGGQFVVEFGGRDNLKTIVKAMKQVFPPPPASAQVDSRTPSPYFHDEHVDTWYYPSIADFTGRLAAHKIEVTSAALFDRPTLLDKGEDGMENWIRMFGSKYWRHLGLSQQEIDERILQAVELLRPQLYDPATGQWTADYRRIRIVGRKLA